MKTFKRHVLVFEDAVSRCHGIPLRRKFLSPVYEDGDKFGEMSALNFIESQARQSGLTRAELKSHKRVLAEVP